MKKVGFIWLGLPGACLFLIAALALSQELTQSAPETFLPLSPALAPRSPKDAPTTSSLAILAPQNLPHFLTPAPGRDPGTGDEGALVQVRSILVAIKGATGAQPEIARSPVQSLTRAQMVEKLARQAGADFSLLAKRYSDDLNASMGGYCPPFRLAGIEPALAKTIMALKPGQVSQPAQTPHGYYVLERLTDPAGTEAALKGPVKIRGILVSYSGAKGALPGIRRSYSEARNAALDLRARSMNPSEKFDALAEEYSDDPSAVRGGWMGAIKLEDLRPDVAKTLARLHPGEVSPVLETPLGFNIFRREE